MRLRQKFKDFISDETGQSTTEYILILAVVVMIVMKLRTTLVGRLQGAADQIGNKIDEAISLE